MKIVVIASGYFDPLHVGHIEYLEKAASLGDKLVVIVNNDAQTVAKKGYRFMDCSERVRIVSALKFVDVVIMSIDEDQSVCKTLKHVSQWYNDCRYIFAKGGDRLKSNIPEVEVCAALGIGIEDGLGKKIQSSSELVALSPLNYTVFKPWGDFITFVKNQKVTVKILNITTGEMTSLQSHNKREEHWHVLDGCISVQTGTDEYTKIKLYSAGDYIFIGKQVVHRISGINDARVLEISYGEFDEVDIIRWGDKYGRK